MVRVTIEWFTHLKEKYGSDHPRRTEIKSFDTIVAAKVLMPTRNYILTVRKVSSVQV